MSPRPSVTIERERSAIPHHTVPIETQPVSLESPADHRRSIRLRPMDPADNARLERRR